MSVDLKNRLLHSPPVRVMNRQVPLVRVNSSTTGYYQKLN
jgi:hypothetical protein